MPFKLSIIQKPKFIKVMSNLKPQTSPKRQTLKRCHFCIFSLPLPKQNGKNTSMLHKYF
uniref:Uncharacterized protein n=1 Tax=Rhizophora mucronata TaxID=61149 RepID=A0A2P2K5P5_RHIMU